MPDSILPPIDWLLYKSISHQRSRLSNILTFSHCYWLMYHFVGMLELLLCHWMGLGTHIKPNICWGGYRCQNGLTSGSSAPPTVIPRVYYRNPLEGGPQHPPRWCMCCLGWRWSVHARAIFDLAAWCCAVYFAPPTAVIKTICGD